MAIISKRNTFKKNFSWNFLGEVIYAATQWGLIVIITRIGNVEMAGLYSFALAITAPIMMFTNLELRTVQATDVGEKNDISSYASLRLVSNILFLFSLFIIMYFIDYSSETYVIIILIAISKLIESWSDITYGYFHMKERMEYISISRIIRGSATFLIVFLVMFITENLQYAVTSLVIVWLLNFLFYDLRIMKKFDEDIKIHLSNKLLDIAKIALPLGIMMLIISLNTHLPRIFIENYLGLEMLGYFTTIFYFVMIGNKFVRSVFQTALPKLSRYSSVGDFKNFKSLISKMFILALITGVIGIIISYYWGDIILVIIYGNEFQDMQPIFILTMVYGLFMYLSGSLTVALNALRYFKLQSFLSIIWLITLLILTLYFIPTHGLIGAGIALILYSFIRFITIISALLYGLKKQSSKWEFLG